MTDAMDDGEALRMAKAAYLASTTYFDASIRNQIEGDLRQFNGQHPAGSKYLSDAYRWRSRLFRPKTRATIRKNEAVAAEAFFTTNDAISIKPEDDANAKQRASAVIAQALLQYRLTKSVPWFLTLMGAYQDAQSVGVVCSHQYWEWNPAKSIDRPCIDLVPIENLRIDQAAKWYDPINTSPYVIEMIPMYVKDVRAKMRRVDPRTSAPRWKPIPDADILSAAKMSSDTIRMTREGKRTDSQDSNNEVSDFSVVWVHRNIVEVDGVDYIYYTLGTERLLTSPEPLQKEYWHGKRPYVMGFCVVETHKIYPSGVGRLVKDVQAEINEIANSRIDNVKFALNKRYFVKRGKRVDVRSLTRNVPGGVTMMDDMEDVKVQETNDVTASSYKEQDMLNLDFDDVAGAFSGASVQSNRRLNETVGGMNILTSNANQVSGYQLRTFVETWVEPVLRQMVLLEQYYETDDKILNLAGAQAAEDFQKAGVDSLTDEILIQELSISVNVGMGSTNPTDKVNNLMMGVNGLKTILEGGLLERYGLKVADVIKEIFGALGWKDGARFFENPESQDPQILALRKQVGELQQALDAKQPPELVAAQVAKLSADTEKIVSERVESGVKAAFAAMQAGQVIATMPQVAPIADKVMQSAGYQPPKPAGVDPDYPVADVPAPPMDIEQNTSPTFPATPESPEDGAMEGIETMRVDS